MGLQLINLVILALILCLQVFLSGKENKFLGLILPTFSILFSLVFLLNATTFSIGMIAFITANIPTVILLLIYLNQRRKIKSKNDINRMNIQDLD